jgi:tricorn protease
MPFRAWYVKKSGLNMENDAPAVPDYLVKNAPGWVARGEDAQLQKAVDVLLEQIE